MKPIVYLPIEFRARELDSKALLAAELASRGYAVIFGQQWMLYRNIARLPAGVFLFKSFNKIHHAAQAQAKAAGHLVVSLEEELLGQIDAKNILASSPESFFTLPDLVLAHGEFERDTLRGIAPPGLRIEVAGNGRVDLLKPAFRSFFEEEMAAVRKAHGEFVLFNTNFGNVNSHWGGPEQTRELAIKAGYLNPADEKSLADFDDIVAMEKSNLAAVHEVIAGLRARRPQLRLLVRPHPGEKIEYWQGIYGKDPAIRVVREGSHFPWTFCSSLLIHTSCTTGFEAAAAGKQAFCLRPLQNWYTDAFMAARINPVYADAQQTLSAVDAWLDQGTAPAVSEPQFDASRYVWNFGERSGTERIAVLLVDLLPPPGAIDLPPLETVQRDQRLRNKYDVSPQECMEVVRRLLRTGQVPMSSANLTMLGEGLFAISPDPKNPPRGRPRRAAPAVTGAGTGADATRPLPPVLPIEEQFRKAREMYAQAQTAFREGRFAEVHQLFRSDYYSAQRLPEFSMLAGQALLAAGQPAKASQYLDQACLGNRMPAELAAALAEARLALGDATAALTAARIAYDQDPHDPRAFERYQRARALAGLLAVPHWIVVGDSHVRNLRYLQTNRARYFADAVHFECHEFGGASAYGLRNMDARSGALARVVQIGERLRTADRVALLFGEIDARRASWKVAQERSLPIECVIGDAVASVREFLEQHILPKTRRVVLLGAKPQIVPDEDLYQTMAVDSRLVFQPLSERQRVNTLFNDGIRTLAAEFGIDFGDVSGPLASPADWEAFHARAFWDDYTDDPHGNVELFAELYAGAIRPLLAA